MSPPSRHRGVSLIELVMVIVVLSVASVGLITGFTQLPRSLLLSEDVQTTAQLAQECAEHILASRRNLGFTSAFTDCSTLPAFGGYGPPAVVRTPGWAGAGCPGGANCTHYQVTASYGTTAATSVMEFFIVEY
jgi:prepilin-type N-terminal cleavage/methylation domain-containing protein